MSITLTITDNGDGTATAAISGSAGGSANTLYAANVNGGFGAANWVSAGTHTVDGSITVSALAAWYYWWRVENVAAGSTTQSNLVYQAIASTTDPVHLQCCKAVQSVIQSLALVDVPSETPAQAYARAYAAVGSPWLSPATQAILQQLAVSAPTTRRSQRLERQYALRSLMLGGPDGQVM